MQESSDTGDKARAQTGPFSFRSYSCFSRPISPPIQKQTRLRSTLLIGARRDGDNLVASFAIEKNRARARERENRERSSNRHERHCAERGSGMNVFQSLIRRVTVALYRMLASGKRIFFSSSRGSGAFISPERCRNEVRVHLIMINKTECTMFSLYLCSCGANIQ